MTVIPMFPSLILHNLPGAYLQALVKGCPYQIMVRSRIDVQVSPDQYSTDYLGGFT